jgi:hypothetical protein
MMEQLMVLISSLLCQSFVVQENVRRVTHKYPKIEFWSVCWYQKQTKSSDSHDPHISLIAEFICMAGTPRPNIEFQIASHLKGMAIPHCFSIANNRRQSMGLSL